MEEMEGKRKDKKYFFFSFLFFFRFFFSIFFPRFHFFSHFYFSRIAGLFFFFWVKFLWSPLGSLGEFTCVGGSLATVL